MSELFEALPSSSLGLDFEIVDDIAVEFVRLDLAPALLANILSNPAFLTYILYDSALLLSLSLTSFLIKRLTHLYRLDLSFNELCLWFSSDVAIIFVLKSLPKSLRGYILIWDSPIYFPLWMKITAWLRAILPLYIFKTLSPVPLQLLQLLPQRYTLLLYPLILSLQPLNTYLLAQLTMIMGLWPWTDMDHALSQRLIWNKNP